MSHVKVPPEIWLLISKEIHPNPIVYYNLAQVCKSARQVFTSDRLWRWLTPVEAETAFYNVVDKRLRQKSAQTAQEIRKNWLAAGDPQVHGKKVSRKVRQDPDLALSACASASPEILEDVKFTNKFWKCALKQNPMLLELAPGVFKSRADLVLFAINEANCSPVFLESGAPVLQHLPVAIAAIERAPNSISKIPTSFLQKNMELVVRAVQLYPWVIIQDSLQEFRDDAKIAGLAVSKSGQLLGILSERLQTNRDIVLAAVKNYGAALQNASPSLQADQNIVLCAVSSYGLALKYAAPELRDNKEIVLAAVKNNGDARAFASKKLQLDRDIIAHSLMSMRSQ